VQKLTYLIVHLSQRRCHLVRQGAGDNHDIRLTGRRSENDTETILVVSGGGHVHHFDGAASQTDCEYVHETSQRRDVKSCLQVMGHIEP
jgi:hypothetical protein